MFSEPLKPIVLIMIALCVMVMLAIVVSSIFLFTGVINLIVGFFLVYKLFNLGTDIYSVCCYKSVYHSVQNQLEKGIHPNTIFFKSSVAEKYAFIGKDLVDENNNKFLLRVINIILGLATYTFIFPKVYMQEISNFKGIYTVILTILIVVTYSLGAFSIYDKDTTLIKNRILYTSDMSKQLNTFERLSLYLYNRSKFKINITGEVLKFVISSLLFILSLALIYML